MLKRIINILCAIPSDKMLHFIAGLMIVVVTAIVFPCAANYAIVSAIIAGFFEEAIDEFDYGGWDWWDIAATVIGGSIMQLVIWVM